MATRTTNLNLYKPTVGGDTDNWGGFLNNNAAYIDALFAKSSAAVTLHVNNQQIDGTSSYLFDSVKMGDDRQLQFGAAPDYWLIYDSSNTQFELNSTNVDGSGTDGVVFSVSDGTDDVAFTGKISTAQVDILAEGDLRLQDASGGQYVGFDAPATVSGSYTLTLPAAVGSSGQILRTSDGSGTLEWVTDQEGDLKSVADATNGGLTVTNGTGPDVTLALNFNDLSAAAVSVANDSIAIIDASDSNGTRKESIADLATAMGGTGLTGSSGTLNVDAAQTQITSVGALNAGSITSGFGAIDVGSSAISGGAGTLSSLSVGDGNITNVGDIALDSISSDGSAIAIGGTGDTVTCNGAWIFNESSADVDFRIEGNGEANLFFVDAGNDRIGINTNAPTAKLHLLQSAADYDSGIKLVGSDSVISGRIWMGSGHLNIDNATAGTGTGLTLEDDGTLTYGGDFLDVADGVTTIGGTDTSKLQFHNAAGVLRSFLTLNSTSLEIDTDSAIIFSANNSERARIDDQGRLGLGTSAPHGYYSVSNKFVIANTSGSTGMTFATSNTGQARIDFAEGTSGAEQYRGTISYQHAATESEGYLRYVSAGNEIFRMEGTIVTCGRTSANASTVDGHQWYASGGYYNYHAAGEVVRWYNTDNGNDVGSIDTSTSSTAYNTSSDRRLKENIEAADPSGSLIDSIEIVKHDWISSDDHVRYGVVAQDLFEVLPEAVSQGTDGDLVDEDLSSKEQPIKQVWGVDYSKLVPLLVKEVQDLRIRVAELEA
jgi:hypothetical protein